MRVRKFARCGILLAALAMPLAATAQEPTSPKVIKQVQHELNAKGFDAGPVDGIWGPLTERAVTNFQEKQGLEATGELDRKTLAALGIEPEKKLAEPAGDKGPADKETTQAEKEMRAIKDPKDLQLADTDLADKLTDVDEEAEWDTEMKTTLIESPLGKLSDTELQILAHIHHKDMMEVQMGQLAMEKGTTFAIKSYGKTLVKDHRANARLIVALVEKQDKALPNLRPITDAEKADIASAKEILAQLHRLDGIEFDRTFLRSQIALHDRTLATLERYVAMIKDNPDLVELIRSMRPVLYQHLQTARTLLAAGIEEPVRE